MQPPWTVSWDVLFRSSQQCSALLALAPVGAGKPALSFPGLLNLMSSLSDLKALQNCVFKSDVVCVLPGAGLASDLNSAKNFFLCCQCELCSSVEVCHGSGGKR